MFRLISVFVMLLFVTVAPSAANTWFTLADYRELKTRDIETAQLVLQAMREAVFYAQESIGTEVICASPKPVAGERLVEMFEAEVEKPTNSRGMKYEETDQAAFIFLHALKNEKVCR